MRFRLRFKKSLAIAVAMPWCTQIPKSFGNALLFQGLVLCFACFGAIAEVTGWDCRCLISVFLSRLMHLVLSLSVFVSLSVGVRSTAGGFFNLSIYLSLYSRNLSMYSSNSP